MELPSGFISESIGTLAVVRSVDYNPDTHLLEFEVENEVLFGDNEPHPFYWPSTADPGLSYPSSKDPFAGSP